MKIRIQTEDFDVGAETAALNITGAGALASFVGIVRGDNGVQSLTLEHYPRMTEREIARLVEEAKNRWPIGDVTVIHRVGKLAVGARIVLVLVTSPHRGAAFDACEFLIDQMKTNAPFWKEEEKNGRKDWVAARSSDHDAAETWRR